MSTHSAIPPEIDQIGAETLDIISKATSFNQWMYKTIAPFLKGHILEIGSGIGNISGFALEEHDHITLSDYNPDYCSKLKQRFNQHKNIRGIYSIDLQTEDFSTKYARFENAFDSIFMLNVIEHLADDKAAIENCQFMLKPKGHLIILAPAYPYLFCRLDKELGHFRRYSINSLSSLFDTTSIATIHRQYFNATGIAGWFLFGKILNNRQIGSEEMSLYNKLVPLLKMVDRVLLKKAGLSVFIVGEKQ